MKTKSEFIKMFHLTKVEKISFCVGRSKCVERMMYTDGFDNFFVFYNNDLISLHVWVDTKGRNRYRLSAGYSWYH